jgi:NAD(P)-dependent dehydrogenase (short-subunit alcohol dehydrogenase family)
MTPMQDVAGKVAFITGGASGVGFGMAKVFLEAGMKVVIADIRQDHLDAAMGLLPGAHPIRLDVTDRAAMASAAAETERVFGKVHVVCNNAGINLFTDIGTATYSDWDWIMGVNFGGVVNGVQAFVPRIKAHGEGGHVINTASMASFIVGPGAGIYTTSKFAVRGLSEALRWSLAPHGIGVSVLCPGLVKSTIYESERIRPAHLAGSKMDPAFVARLEQVHKLGMEPEEVGRKVLRGMLAIFDAALASLPEETPPAERLAFEESRRAGYTAARRTWKTRDPLK